MNCLNCKAPIIQTPGKREKKFCSDLCRAKYGQKKKGSCIAGEPVTVAIKAPEDPNKLQNELNELINLPHNKEKVRAAIIENKGRKVTLTEKPTMPKGLSLQEQIDWKINNSK